MKNNGVFLYMYKSGRKNAMCELIKVNHLISKNNGKISDARILDQFISNIDLIVNQSIKYNKILEVSSIIFIDKESSYIDANGENYEALETIKFYNNRRRFYSLENCINYIYSLFFLVYPYNNLHLKTIYNNPSIKYIINKYYK